MVGSMIMRIVPHALIRLVTKGEITHRLRGAPPEYPVGTVFDIPKNTPHTSIYIGTEQVANILAEADPC